MKIIRFISFIVLLIACMPWQACQKPEPFPVDQIGNQAAFGSLKISVKFIYQTIPEVRDSSVNGAGIRIYASVFDRDAEIGRLAERNSDSLGMVYFESLQAGLLYLRIRHPRFGVIDDSVRIIPGTKSMVDVFYY